VTVSMTVHLGTETDVVFPIDAVPIGTVPIDTVPIDTVPFEHASLGAAGQNTGTADTRARWTARVSSRSTARPWEPLELAVNTGALYFFDPASGRFLLLSREKD
jgi:multiple sugar transport system ATP-binding protein